MSEPRIGPPIDLAALAFHATQIPEEIEATWAATWLSGASERDRAAVGVRLSGLATGLIEHQHSIEEELEAVGVLALIPELPPFRGQHSRLVGDADSRGSLLRAQMAQFSALTHLLESIAGLTEPHGSDPTGRTKASPRLVASSFSAAQARAGLLVRTTAVYERAAATIVDVKTAPSDPRFMERRQLAQLAWERGDPEAAATHGVLAARLFVAYLAGVTIGELPGRLSPALHAESGWLAALANLLQVCEEALESVANGLPPDLAALTVAIPNLLELLDALFASPPRALLVSWATHGATT